MKSTLFFLTTLSTVSLFAASASWNTALSGNWSDGMKWNPMSPPNGAGDVATFDHMAGDTVTVTVDSTFSVSSISHPNFGPPIVLSSSGGGFLNLYDSVSTGSMLVSTLAINCPIVLQGDVNLDVSPMAGQVSFAGGLSGTGGLTLSTGATIQFQLGSSTYSGDTTINDGTFSALSSNTLSSNSTFILADAAGAVLALNGHNQQIGNLSGGAASSISGGILTLGDAATTEYAGTILNGLGTAGIVKQGSGTFTLSGTNTYTGGTTVNAGTLAISNEDNIGGGMANLNLGGGTLHATGDVVSMGDVDVTSSSTITVDSGKTATFSGTLTGSNGQILTLSGMGQASVGSTIDISGADVFTLAGTNHQATFSKAGTGTLILTGDSSYFGGINLGVGTLAVNGSVGGMMTVVDGATLKGTGTVGFVDVQAGATVSPGNSIGTLTSVDPVTFHAGSIFHVEISPTDASKLIVGNTATLAGTVDVTIDPGSYGSGGQKLILTGSPIMGAFDTLNATLEGYTFSLSQIGNDLYLLYSGPPVSSASIPTANLSGNALRIANYLNTNGATSTLGLFNGLTGSSLANALNSVSPARNAFGAYIAQQTAFSVSQLMSTRLDGQRALRGSNTQQDFVAALIVDASDQVKVTKKTKGSKNSVSLWASGFGEIAHQKASLQNPSFRYTSGAALTGIDYSTPKGNLVGASIGYAATSFHESAHAGHGHINYYMGSLYGNGFIGQFYLSPAVWGIFNKTDQTRHISFPGFSAHAKADISSWQLVPHLEAGYDFACSWGDIVPFTAADWAITWQRRYKEHGASPFNAHQKSHRSSMVRSETGLKFYQQWQYNWGAFVLKEKGSYVYEKPFKTGTVNTAFVGTPSSFTVTAVNQPLNLGAVGLNFLFAVGKKAPVTIEFGYEGEFGSHYWSHDIMLTLAKKF